MSKASKTSSRKPPRPEPEYDFSKGEVGRYAGRMPAKGKLVHIVELDPDVAEVFPDSTAVNKALRGLVRIVRDTRGRKAG